MRQEKQSLERWTKLWQPEGLSSHWTTALTDRWYFLLLLGLTFFHFYLSTQIPLTDDEVYYWTWAQDLAPGYFDHPPLIAYLMKLTTSMFGDSAFSIRLSATVISFLILWILGTIAQRKLVLFFVALTPIFLWGGILATPDVPFLFFWLLYLVWFIKLNERLSSWSEDPVARVYRASGVGWSNWIMGGVFLGLGCLSKYSMLLLIPCTLFFLFTQYRFKGWIQGFILHILVATILCLPLLTFLWNHDFEPFIFQWHHGMANKGFSFSALGNFVGSQILLVGALPFALLPFVAFNRIISNPTSRCLAIFFLFPFLFMLYRATQTQVEGNWALMSYLSLWPLAQHMMMRSSFDSLWKILLGICFCIPLATSFLLLVHRTTPLEFIKPKNDRLHQMTGLNEVFDDAVQKIHVQKLPVFGPSYQIVSQLRYRGVEAHQFGNFGRKSQYTMVRVDHCKFPSILALAASPLPEDSLKCFKESQILYEFPLYVRGDILQSYRLIKYQNPS